MAAKTDEHLISELAERYSISHGGVRAVLDALRSGGGSMAQFSHADFGGMSQWSSGMTMVGDMFNHDLKSKLNSVATDLADYLRDRPTAEDSVSDDVSYQSQPSRSSNWWPEGMGHPSSVGAQNDIRYAIFPDSRRLVLEDHGRLQIYDTGDHKIFGVGQTQGSATTISFTSESGLVKVADLTQVR